MTQGKPKAKPRHQAASVGLRKTLVISNYDPLSDELIFENDRAVWNVSRALRDCAAGKHECWVIDVAQAYENNSAVEVDEAKVVRFMRTPAVFELPLIGVMEDGMAWMIDGHHRLRALQRLGIKDAVSYIIKEADSAPYKVWYNGQRKPPFKVI
jgi:hypothetical protein